MAPKVLKHFLNKLKRKRVHRIIDSLQNSTSIHRYFATSSGRFPATSTTIADGFRVQPHPDLSDHSFAFNNSVILSDQSVEVSIQATLALERSFRCYFGDANAFSTQNIRCSADAYNSWIRLKHSRDTLQQMVDFRASQHRRLEGYEPLMDTYFRCFYDFVTASMNQLENAFPGLHAYRSNRQSINKHHRFHSVCLPRQTRFSESISSGYTSCSSSSTIQGHPPYILRQTQHFGAMPEWEEQEYRIDFL